MTRAVLAAQSGWGKSWMTQQWTESNLDGVDALVVLDYKDEYRGLCKAGLAKWAGVGDAEAGLDVDGWASMLEANPRMVLARAVDDERWRSVAAAVSKAARSYNGDVLVVLDEAHFLAPQGRKYPDEIKGLATTGRGERVSSMWVTQRIAEIDKTVTSQADVRIFGGFISPNDLGKVDATVDYSSQVHNPQLEAVHGIPDEIDRDGEPVQIWKEDGQTLGSEWIYSTTSGERRRLDSRDLDMSSTHYGAEGMDIDPPG